MNIGWPEGIYLALALIGLGWVVANDGKPRDPHNAVSATLASALILGLLWWGGFFA